MWYSHEALVFSREGDFDAVVVDPQSVRGIIIHQFLSVRSVFHLHKRLKNKTDVTVKYCITEWY